MYWKLGFRGKRSGIQFFWSETNQGWTEYWLKAMIFTDETKKAFYEQHPQVRSEKLNELKVNEKGVLIR